MEIKSSALALIVIVFGLLSGCGQAPANPVSLGDLNGPVGNDNNMLLGSDRDAHGCIGSAGYSWCEVKGKCLRIWEEPCEIGPDSGNPKICTMEYAPVCGRSLLCPTCAQSPLPCPPCMYETRTFGNRCQAEEEGAEILYQGECKHNGIAGQGDGSFDDVIYRDDYLVGGAGSAGIANPASVNCIDNNGSLKIVSDENGNQFGMCTLPSGKVCEEWAYFRGECKDI